MGHRMIRFLCRLLVAGLVSTSAGAASAEGPGVPSFDVRRSCENAKEFSRDFRSGSDYRSCLADEKRAKLTLARTWSLYSSDQKRQCLEPGPDPSYVETLTCLQLNGDDIGGPIAPGVEFK